MKKRILSLIISGFVFFILLPCKAFSQNISLGIYPPIFQAVIKPGEYITQVFNIYNYSQTNLVLKSSLNAFKPEGEKGKVKLLPVKTSLLPLNFSYLNSNLNPDEPFVVKANSHQQIVLKIKALENTPEKDYYASLIFETQPVKSFIPLSSSITKTKIGSNLLISVSKTGKPQRKAQIKEFSLKGPKIIDSFDKGQFIIRIENTGNFFVKPKGTIKTLGWFGQSFEQSLLPENILSGSIREINCFKEENEEIKPLPCALDSSFLLGLYHSTLEFQIEDNGPLLKSTISFFALPWKLILGLTITILIVKLILSKKAS